MPPVGDDPVARRRRVARARWRRRPAAAAPPRRASSVLFRIGVVSKSTPYLAALARRRGGRTSPHPEFKKWRRRPARGASGSVRLRVALLTNVAGKISKKNCRKRIARKRNWRSAAQPARAGWSADRARRVGARLTRARELSAIKTNALGGLPRARTPSRSFCPVSRRNAMPSST